MRRFLVAALAVSALALAACGTDEGAGQPAAAGGADTTVATATACTEAELSGEPVAEDVKAALTETAATVKKIADPEDNTPINAATQQLAGIADKIGAACA